MVCRVKCFDGGCVCQADKRKRPFKCPKGRKGPSIQQNNNLDKVASVNKSKSNIQSNEKQLLE